MKLFCFDIDQTLLPLGNIELLQEEKDALQALLNNGHAIALASGRPYLAQKHLWRDLIGTNKYFIAANGAAVYDLEGNIITQSHLSSKDMMHLTKKYLRDGITIYAFEGTRGVLCYRKDKWTDIEQQLNFMPDESVVVVDPNKPIQGHDHLLKVMIAGEEEIIAKFHFDEEDERKYEHCMSSVNYFEVLEKGTSKGAGVDALRKHLRIDASDIYCFGDQDNDVSMVKMFNGVAMENAIENLKKVAKFHTKSASEHGVPYALKHILKVI